MLGASVAQSPSKLVCFCFFAESLFLRRRTEGTPEEKIAAKDIVAMCKEKGYLAK
jgi:hypothetical protein